MDKQPQGEAFGQAPPLNSFVQGSSPQDGVHRKRRAERSSQMLAADIQARSTSSDVGQNGDEKWDPSLLDALSRLITELKTQENQPGVSAGEEPLAQPTMAQPAVAQPTMVQSTMPQPAEGNTGWLHPVTNLTSPIERGTKPLPEKAGQGSAGMQPLTPSARPLNGSDNEYSTFTQYRQSVEQGSPGGYAASADDTVWHAESNASSYWGNGGAERMTAVRQELQHQITATPPVSCADQAQIEMPQQTLQPMSQPMPPGGAWDTARGNWVAQARPQTEASQQTLHQMPPGGAGDTPPVSTASQPKVDQEVMRQSSVLPLTIPNWQPPSHFPQAAASSSQAEHGKQPATPERVMSARRDRLEQKSEIISFFLKLAILAACGYVLLTFVFGFAVMSGESMYPRVRDGDLLLYYRLEDSFSIGDVVTFRRDGIRFTGRVAAQAGDTVDINEVGQLVVNGNVQTEEIFYPTMVAEFGGVPMPLVLAQDSLFILCDMRTNGTDSRVFGPVRMSEVDGKVISVLRRRGI